MREARGKQNIPALLPCKGTSMCAHRETSPSGYNKERIKTKKKNKVMWRKPDAKTRQREKRRYNTIKRIKDAKKEETITKEKRYNRERKYGRRMQNKVENDNQS